MNTYILDTNIFFNLQIESELGNNPHEIMQSVTHYARVLRQAQKAAFYMPPLIVEELYSFVDTSDPVMRELVSELTVKAPEKDSMTFSAAVFYDLVQDIRNRSYRGLQVAEEELSHAVKDMSGSTEMDHISYQKAIGGHITRLRDRYRNATRVKFLDSVADLDIIALAKELDGIVVSADEGVIQWARKFGVREVYPHVLKLQLESLLQA